LFAAQQSYVLIQEVDRKREMHRRVAVNPSQEIAKKIFKMFFFPSWKCMV
jgi:hypothetical protein